MAEVIREMKEIGNRGLAIGLASILALSVASLAMPALATSGSYNMKSHDNKNSYDNMKSHDNKGKQQFSLEQLIKILLEKFYFGQKSDFSQMSWN